jgi:hypothetical protein
MVKSYSEAAEYLAGGRSKTDRPLANNTRLVKRGENSIAVILHGTDVVTFHHDGRITLTTGGWNTVTTKDRINTYSPARVGSVKGELFIYHDGDPVSPAKIQKCRVCKGTGKTPRYCYGPACDYKTGKRVGTCDHGETGYHAAGRQDCYRCGGEGKRDYGSNRIPTPWDGGPIDVDATGKVLTPPPDDGGERKRERDRIRKEINVFAKLAGETHDPAVKPGPGDCFFCQMETEQGEALGDATGDTSHLLSHMEEGYVVPSLVFRALKERGYVDPGLIYMLGHADAITRAVRRYMGARLLGKGAMV